MNKKSKVNASKRVATIRRDFEAAIKAVKDRGDIDIVLVHGWDLPAAKAHIYEDLENYMIRWKAADPVRYDVYVEVKPGEIKMEPKEEGEEKKIKVEEDQSD